MLLVVPDHSRSSGWLVIHLFAGLSDGLESSTPSSCFFLFTDQCIFFLLPYNGGIEMEEIV
jgi:hypothetical protein